MQTAAGGARAGVAAEEMRRHNLGAVLERVHLEPAGLTRSELVSRTGLNRSTMSALVRELAGLGLVEEGAPPQATGPGRPSPTVRARAEGAVALAVEIVVDSISVATVGLGGLVYNLLQVTRRRGSFSPEATVAAAANLARPLLESLPAGHVLAGVGVAVAGVTRRADGLVQFAPNLGWRDVPLAALLDGGLGLDVPVHVANEADLGALAEHRRGWPGVANLVYVSGEVGIGAGVIVDGRPMLGAEGYAGEAGHMLVNPGGRRCGCGAVGCWETEASEGALLRKAGLKSGPAGMARFLARAEAGEADALRAMADVGRWLGLGLGSLVNLFNPEVVVLGGMYRDLYAFLESPVLEHLPRQALEASRADATVVRSAVEPDAPLLGAAELALTPVLLDPAGIVAGRQAVGSTEGAGDAR